MNQHWKRMARGLTPPMVWNGIKSIVKPAPLAVPAAPPPPLHWPGERAVTTLAELDREIQQCDEANTQSDDALRKAFTGFYFDPAFTLPPDPFSNEYRDAQLELYRMVSGREGYDSFQNEKTEFDLPTMIQTPYPYYTKSAHTVGEQLMMIGLAIKQMGVAPGASILEFGPGWGNTTLELAKMGYAVTAIDINKKFVDLILGRAQRLGLSIDARQGDMLNYPLEKRFDCVFFYECFHHCSDHIQLVQRLDSLVNQHGTVVIAWEPIWDYCPVPWGLRLDGVSVWSTRKFGWLELGFHTDYFMALMAKHGWSVTHTPANFGNGNGIFVAKRKTDAAS